MPRLISLLVILSLFLSLASPLSVFAGEQTILLTKTADMDTAGIGDTITYTYTITNNSTSDNVTNLVLIDDKIAGNIIPLDTALAPGENTTATAYYTVKKSDYLGSATAIVNNVTLSGNMLPSGDNATANATASVALIRTDGLLSLNKEADVTSAALGDNITYTYTLINNGTTAITNLKLHDNKLGNIPLVSGDITITSLQAGENITAAATYKVTWKDVWKGAITNVVTAKGLVDGEPVAARDSFTVSTRILGALINKAEILFGRGVPGKGILKAPGLQKPFNPDSQAEEHAGKKDAQGHMEQNGNWWKNQNLQNQEQELNGNTEQNQQQEMNRNTHKNKKNNSGNGNHQN